MSEPDVTWRPDSMPLDAVLRDVAHAARLGQFGAEEARWLVGYIEEHFAGHCRRRGCLLRSSRDATTEDGTSVTLTPRPLTHNTHGKDRA